MINHSRIRMGKAGNNVYAINANDTTGTTNPLAVDVITKADA